MASGAGVANTYVAFSPAWGDYNGDGHPDLFVGNNINSVLYSNDGDGTFTNATSAAGVSSTSARGAAWGDYDGDGDLDLYVAHSSAANKLFENNGAGTFTNVATAAVASADSSLGVSWADYDGDGDLDLYVSNTPYKANILYRNDGGTFVVTGEAAGGSSSLGVSWGDYDGDGDPDLYVANGANGTRQANVLYRNDAGAFTATGLAADEGVGHSGTWADYDGDGDLDLYVTNTFSPNALYRNDGSDVFVDITLDEGAADPRVSRSASWADYDGDGDLDLYVTNDSGNDNALYRNDATVANWLQVELAPTYNAPNGVGARVITVAGAQRQVRYPDGGAGFYAQNATPVFFGLGAETTIDSLIVEWPSGEVSAQVNVAKNQLVTVNEPLFALTGEAASTLNSWGASWGDYDGDGDLDLHVANYGQVDSLYRNDAGVMTPVAVTTMTTGVSNSYGGAWGDYDGDGDLDLSVGIAASSANQLWRNDGGGAFVNAAGTAVVGNANSGYATSWGDFDGDGDLDLYVATNTTNVLYSNDGDGTFTNSGQAANGSISYGATWGDYDGDGDPDLYVVNSVANALYRNDAGVLTLLSGVAADASDGRSGSWGDYDDDGDLDLYVANYSGTSVSNVLYRNDGGDAFVDVSSAAGVASSSPSLSASWVDYDEDGLLDLYVANTLVSGYSPANQMYRNGGDGTFVDVAQSAGVADGGNSYGAAWGDYDGDGDPDLYVANVSSMANALYRNEGTTSKWLSVGLASTVSAPDGNGARVTAVVGSQRQTRTSDGGTGWGGQSVGPVLFGFGPTATSVDSLIVEWPSGLVTTQTGVATNDTLTLSEPTELYALTGEASSTLNGFSASWGDYDGDGDLDLHVANNAQIDSLYRNDAGVMTPVAVTTMTTGTSNSYGGAWGDYDGDGDLDLSVAINGYNLLWRNDGADAFANVTSAAGVYATILSYGTSWVDFDGDGDLDLYWSNNGANVLYSNDGDGTFTNSGQAANGSSIRARRGATTTGTGIRICMSNNGANALYRNDGGVLTLQSGVAADASNGRGASWGDYDDDGDLDLYVPNASATNVSNVLYRNDGVDVNGAEVFSDVSSAAGVASPSLSVSASWVDYDEDGLLDLYVANTFVSGYSRANQLYRNGGDGAFVDVAQSAGVADGGNSYGAAWGDYDGDGDPDLYVANYSSMANALYRNEGTTSKWLSVGLASTVSAPDGNGARDGGGGQSASDAHVRRRHGLGRSERRAGALWLWPGRRRVSIR